MRQRGKLYLWPLYFEASLSRRGGRRVARKLALRGVKLEEVLRAAEDLGLHPEVRPMAAHPSQPWRRSGVVLVEGGRNKSLILRLVAEKMRENRSSKGKIEKH